ncbi:MAG: protein-disulfide reductase DsbD family protein [Fimbriimonadaceae bacterium]
MSKPFRIILTILIGLFGIMAFAEQVPAGSTVESGKITWSVTLKDTDTRIGETTQLLVTGRLPEGWHTYSNHVAKDVDFVPASAKTKIDGNPLEDAGDPIWPAAHILFDKGFQIPVSEYKGEFTVAIPIKIVKAGTQQLQVEMRAQACDESGCDRPRNAVLGIDFTPADGAARPDRAEPDLTAPEQPAGYKAPTEAESTATPEVLAAALAGKAPSIDENGAPQSATEAATKPTDETSKNIADAKAKGLLPFLLLSFGAGLLALLTPCVWPMIPITVSYFTKKSEEGPGAVMKYATAYCLGIIGTFVGLGLIITLAFGASGVQKLAASPIANAFLAVLFIALAINLFGVFEIQVPTKFVNKMQSKSKTAGLAAPILLGFVFSLTTFTCTVPFVGTILVSATTGDLLFPIAGMIAFSLAFALPFFVLALLPNVLKKLPKSGNWLNSVKAYMGFLELAAAMKFVSNIDVIVNDPLWLPFSAFGAIWFAIFVAAALYLFGVVKMPHDDGSTVGIGRRIFAGVNILIAGWLLAGISNAQVLGPMVGFYPPKQSGETTGSLVWNENFEAVKAAALAEGKPIFINFTGKTCTNCRVMEYQKFPMNIYSDELKKFGLVELYTDRETPEDNANADLREKMTNSSTNPTYAILKPDGTHVSTYQGLAKSDEDFINWMKKNYTEALK